jgi:O-antigen/teichoic acid export membrane protein
MITVFTWTGFSPLRLWKNLMDFTPLGNVFRYFTAVRRTVSPQCHADPDVAAEQHDAGRRQDAREPGSFRRVFQNAGLLLGGQGLAGVCGVVALALAARALGSEQFGILILIHTYALVVATAVRFNGWYAVIRYGTMCVSEGRRSDLQGVIRLASLLDAGGAAVGAIGAVAAAPLLGPWLGWQDVVGLGQLYSLTIVFNAVDTPVGILRLFDRFDLLARLRLCSPACRCFGAVAAFALGGDLRVFLIIWFVAEVADAVLLWGFAVRELARRGYLAGMSFTVRGLSRPHPGIWRLLWSTNLNSTLGMVLGRMTTLALGSVLGPASAGFYNVATQFAAVFDRPVEMLRRTLYPELSRFSAVADIAAMRGLAMRSGLLVGTIMVPLVLVGASLAEGILTLVMGEGYAAAATVLGWLLVRQAVLAFGFPLGLMLVSLGQAAVLLKINFVTSVLYVGLLTASLSLWGLDGAGIAAAAAAVFATVLSGTVVAKTVRLQLGAALPSRAPLVS